MSNLNLTVSDPVTASIVAIAPVLVEGLKLAQQLIADQSPEEKTELAKMRTNMLKTVNEFGEFVLEKIRAK